MTELNTSQATTQQHTTPTMRAFLFIALIPAVINGGLLKSIDPILTPDLLWVLRSMGHGDRLVVADANFPAAEVATKTTSGKHIILTTDLPRSLDAILSLLPLDGFVPAPAGYMAPQDGVEMPRAGEEVINEAMATVEKHSPGAKIEPIERFSFYAEARTTYAVVQTLERRPYGNVILTKGVIGPDGKDLKP